MQRARALASLPKNYGTFCHYCRCKYEDTNWPHQCSSCGNITYINPIPVAVGILPVIQSSKKGLLLIQRAIKPFIGEYCFPGGFVDYGEKWQEAVSREIREETSIVTDPEEFSSYGISSTPDATRILIFGLSNKVRNLNEIGINWKPGPEAQSIIIGSANTKLCFSLHQQVYDDLFTKFDRE